MINDKGEILKIARKKTRYMQVNKHRVMEGSSSGTTQVRIVESIFRLGWGRANCRASENENILKREAEKAFSRQSVAEKPHHQWNSTVRNGKGICLGEGKSESAQRNKEQWKS